LEDTERRNSVARMRTLAPVAGSHLADARSLLQRPPEGAAADA
jgi:hypothetical protein